MTLTLVNTDQIKSRTVVVQGGAYGEHQFVSVSHNGVTTSIDGDNFTVAARARLRKQIADPDDSLCQQANLRVSLGQVDSSELQPSGFCQTSFSQLNLLARAIPSKLARKIEWPARVSPMSWFFLCDQLRIDLLSCYAETIVRTPNISALAQDSCVFERAYTPCAICSPGPGQSSDRDCIPIATTCLTIRRRGIPIASICGPAWR